MVNTRRDFIRRSSLFLGAAALLSPRAVLGAAPVALSTSAAIDADVLSFLASYSVAHYIQGGSAVASAANKPAPIVSILAQATDSQSLSAALNAQKFSQVYAEGDDISFFKNGSFYKIESVLDADFPAKLASLAAGTNLDFAHEAVLLNANASELSDPFGVASSPPPVLKTLSATNTLPDDFEIVMKGVIQAERFGLKPDTAFDALIQRTLGSLPTSIEVARAIAGTWIGSLAPLAALVPAATIESIARTPLVSNSIAGASGITAQNMIALFTRIRSQLSPAYFTDASIWLAAILGMKLRVTKGAVSINDSDRFSALQTREALVYARYIAATNLLSPPLKPKAKSKH